MRILELFIAAYQMDLYYISEQSRIDSIIAFVFLSGLINNNFDLFNVFFVFQTRSF